MLYPICISWEKDYIKKTLANFKLYLSNDIPLVLVLRVHFYVCLYDFCNKY